MAMMDIFLESEFAPLRTVVLAQSELTFSEAMLHAPDMALLFADIPWEVQPGRTFGDAYPSFQLAWEEERNALVKILQREGVEVLRPQRLSYAQKLAVDDIGYAGIFVRDAFFVIGDTLIEGALRFPHRRREVLPSRSIILEYVSRSACQYVAVPMPDAASPEDEEMGPGPFLEGGDILVWGKHVFVGVSGLASNELGVRWLERLLHPRGYTVELVRLAPNVFHLNCALSLVREGLMIVCEHALRDGIPSVLASWDSVRVSAETAAQLATNGLSVTGSLYVTDSIFRAVGAELELKGVAVEYLDFRITRGFGGSFHCSTQSLLRV